jgi:hypothetical protein
LKAHKAEVKKAKGKPDVFPFDGNTADDDAARERDMQRMRNARDLLEFQIKQQREKKESEAAEKERTRLEFMHAREKEQAELEAAQVYAKNLLAKAAAEDDEINWD